MNKTVELPLAEPFYSTYHFQGPNTAIDIYSSSLKNFHLNEVMELSCSRKFLHGYTTPELDISRSSWTENPYIERIFYDFKFLKGYSNTVIREMINKGYYVAYSNVDDYYIKNKTWYKKRHFNHDGLICGYNQYEKTYCLYAYDSNWIYKKFWTPQNGFSKGRAHAQKQGVKGEICAIKFNGAKIDFSAESAIKKIKEYINSDMNKYPEDAEGYVKGIVVHEYIAKYIDMLFNNLIPYERMDWRIFRLIFEHKKGMLERIENIEKTFLWNTELSEKYKQTVKQAEVINALYASHKLKRRDSVLPIIKNKFLNIYKQEKEILNILVKKAEGDKNEALEKN